MDNSNSNEPEEITLKEVILKFRSGWKYLLSKWFVILVTGAIGGLTGLAYAYFKQPTYTATSTFVLEDSKAGGLGQYAGLASLAGINVGGLSGGGVFQGDNILELYRSRNMIEQALLSPVGVSGKSQLLVDLYIDFNHLRKQWIKKAETSHIVFNQNSKNFNRSQDSIITDIVKTINDKMLVVKKPDKKLNIIQVDVVSKNELFSKVFNEKLVQTVNNFYTQTKTKRSFQNVLSLQKQADSVRNVLNRSISGVASAIDAAPNANPSLVVLRVPSQKKQIDVQANTAIYSEIVKNLEVSKLSLLQETPLVQMIDQPVLPLEKYRIGYIKGIVVGMVSGIILGLSLVTIKLILRRISY